MKLEAIAILALVCLDQFTKYLAVTYLEPIGTISIIPGVFSFTYLINDGMAFGMLRGHRWLFVVLTVVILGFMYSYYRTIMKDKRCNLLRIALILIAAGAVGNLIDRVLNGYVVDFLHFTLINFPVFNLADCFVCIGAFLVAIVFLFIIKE